VVRVTPLSLRPGPVPLTVNDWLTAVAVGAAPLVAVELAKIVLRARRELPRAATVDVPTRSLSARQGT
jgi:hypothetical protein